MAKFKISNKMLDEAFGMNKAFDAGRAFAKSDGNYLNNLSQTASVRAERSAAYQAKREQLLQRQEVNKAYEASQKEQDVRHAIGQQDRLNDFRKKKMQNRLGSDMQSEMSMRQGMGSYEEQGFATQKDADIAHRRESYQALRDRRQGQLTQDQRMRQAGVDDALQEAQANELAGRGFADIDSPRAASANAANNSPAASVTEASGGSSVNEASMRKGGKDFSSQYNYIKNRQGQNYDYDNIMKGHTDAAGAHDQISKLTGKSMDEVGNMSQDSLKAELGAALHRRASNATIGDKMGYHKVPQTAVGVGATAFLISKMADSKGQMSNSQLYGQASPYGM